jgi:hypothetical protein
MRLLILTLVFALAPVWGQAAPPSPEQPKPVLSAEDTQLVNQIVNDPALDQLRSDLVKSQDAVKHIQDLLATKQENQQLKLNYLFTVRFPETYKMPGYYYAPDKGWVAKPVQPTQPAPPVQK